MLNPDTGQAIALGPLTGDAGLAIGAPSQLVDIAWSPDGRTLYALAFVSVGGSPQNRLHTLTPDTGAILVTVVVTVDHPDLFLTTLGFDTTGALLAAVGFGSPDGPSDLGRLDPATGVLTRRGPTGFRALLGLEFDSAFRTLYAITGFQIPPVLVSLDPATGKGTAIARTDLPTQARSLAFTVEGQAGGRVRPVLLYNAEDDVMGHVIDITAGP